MVYVDLLILENTIFNYIIILSVGLLLNRITQFRKIFLSSTIGNIPIIFLFTNTNKLILVLITIIFSIIMMIISYGYRNIIYTIKNVLYMYASSMFLSCSLYLIKVSLLPDIDNYFLNVIILIGLCPIINYIYLKSITSFKESSSNYYKVDIYLKEKPKKSLVSYLDTGNKLIDPYKHRPIILVNKNLLNYQNEKILLVPYNTINKSDLLECIIPEKIYINTVGYKNKLLIGLVDKIDIEGADCILSPKLLERI